MANLYSANESTFDVAVSGWDATYGLTSITRTTSSPITGAGSIAFLASDTFWGAWKTYPGIAVTVGTVYYVQHKFVLPAGTTVNVSVAWHDSGGATLSTWAVGTASGTGTVTVAGNQAAPAGATTGEVHLDAPGTATAGQTTKGDDFWFGDTAPGGAPPVGASTGVKGKRWNGTSWVLGNWKVWNGTTWVVVDG